MGSLPITLKSRKTKRHLKPELKGKKMESKKLMDLVKGKRSELAAKSNRKEKTAKMKDGKNRVRVLPGWRKDDETFWHDYGQHFIKGLDGQIKAVFTCAEKTYGKPCPVCEGIERSFQSSTDDAVLKKLSEAKARGRVLVNALLPESDEPNKPVILELPVGVFQQILDLMDEWGNVLDIVEGRDIVVNRTGSGINVEYTAQPAAKQTAVAPAVLKNLNNLDDYVREEGEESMRRALLAVNVVSGLLPAAAGAGTPADKPATAYSARTAELLDDDLPDDAPVAASSPIGEVAVADDELDGLLAGLEG